MASCEFAGGIKNVRGTLSKTVSIIDGEKVVKRVVASVTPSGKQRIYLRCSQVRSTPVSEKEIERRNAFAQATKAASSLTEQQLIAYDYAFRISKGIFNGKQYKSVRGYILARFIANQPLTEA